MVPGRVPEAHCYQTRHGQELYPLQEARPDTVRSHRRTRCQDHAEALDRIVRSDNSSTSKRGSTQIDTCSFSGLLRAMFGPSRALER